MKFLEKWNKGLNAFHSAITIENFLKTNLNNELRYDRMIKKHFLEVLRWGLRLHGFSHFIEVLSAVAEGAFITASIALIFISIEILASFYIPKEHIHLKPLKSDIHENCDDVD